MGTHCVIALKYNDWKVNGRRYQGTYVHYDGYPSEIIPALQNLWKQGSEKISLAISKGLSSDLDKVGYYSSFPDSFIKDEAEYEALHLYGDYEWNYLLDFDQGDDKEPIVYVAKRDCSEQYAVRLMDYNPECDLYDQDILALLSKEGFPEKYIQCPHCHQYFENKNV